jgi:hypothetical protein
MQSFVNPDSLMLKTVVSSNSELNQFCILLLLASIIYSTIVHLVAEIALITVLNFRFAKLLKNIYKKPISFYIK